MTRCPPRQTLVLLSQCLAASDAALSSGDMAPSSARPEAASGMGLPSPTWALKRIWSVDSTTSR